MNTEPVVHRVERIDDIPVLWAAVQRLRLAELLDQRFPTHHLWNGDLSFGEVVAVWLVFLLSHGDHRLSRLQPWAAQHRLTLAALLGKTVRPLDFQDDRLADILTALHQAETWLEFENALNCHTVRVYELPTTRFRLDSTTANSHAAVVNEQGLLQFGHSKDRADLPQLKVAVSALDPLGMPTCTLVVPGDSADDPLYLPLIQQTQQAFGQGGKTYVGDCKAAALSTRAYLVSTNDYYLCPLSELQVPRTQRQQWLQPLQAGQHTLQPVYRPTDDPTTPPELVAEGFYVDTVLQAEVADRTLTWTERRWVVRSVAFAEAQQQALEQRLQRAQTDLEQLCVRKQGKRVLSAAELPSAVLALLQQHRVEGLLTAEVQTTRHERSQRRYRERPVQTVVTEEHRVVVQRQEAAIRAARAELGWQVYGVNDLDWSLAEVVWAYRGQYQIEKGWSRLKGRPLSLTPMYLTDEGRMLGLVLLLSLALRVLTVLQWQLRRRLSESGARLRGLYPGQPGRATPRPSAELLLEAFRGISLTVLVENGQERRLLTALTPLQEQLLALWDFPADLYQRLTQIHFSQPPPVLSER